MGFWERFESECNKIGKKPNPVAQEIGISSGSVTKWKSGAIPKSTVLLKIANYFGVSAAYLLGETDDPFTTPVDINPKDISYALFSQSQDLTEEEMQEVIEFIQFKKSQRRSKQP